MNIDREKIEKKWKEEWKKNKPKIEKEKEKYFITVPIPYPDGPVHLGHAYTWGRADIYARFKRMQGLNVLWPQGFHFTGGPLVGMSIKIKNKDTQLLHVLKDVYNIKESELKEFEDPLALGSYFAEQIKKTFEEAAFSIDWSKQFKTIDPQFQKFVAWQFRHLYNKGLIYKGSHPVIWCPREKTALGDHDRAEGEGESPVKFHIIKFYVDDLVLPAATLRPETIFGVTNLWINPEIQYVKAKVNNETWVVAKDTIIKLENQGKEIKEVEDFDIASLVNKTARDKINKKEIPILPADFVNDKGTGIVMSVPAHAPFDYFYIKNANVNITPKKVIDVPGESLDIEKVMSMFNKTKKGLEEATKYLYRVEKERGILNKNTPFDGLPVSNSEEKIVELLVQHKVYDEIYDTINPVICRCGAKGIVKIVENQWFIKYSDEEWKKKALKAVEKMKIYPEEARNMLINSIIDLEDKACTRSGERELGTTFPWDNSQVIEPLSDSTIYMAYYTIADLIKKLPNDIINDELFDYVFLNKKDAKIPEQYKDIIEEMRESFEYWYPVDMRITAKELIPNHITFWIMNHVELFDESKWPKGLQTNGWIKINDVKMSKSKGNGILIEDFVKKEGIDKLRMIACLGNGIDDENVSLDELKSYDQKINFLLSVVELLNAFGDENKLIDKYLISFEQRLIKSVTEDLESFRFRNALVLAFFEGIEKLKWYLDAGGNNKQTVTEYINTLIKLLHPIFPVITEEINTIFQSTQLEAYNSWPTFNDQKIDENVEKAFKVVDQTIEDINAIISAVGREPAKIEIYTADKSRFDTIAKIIEEKKNGKNVKEILKEIDDIEIKKILAKKGIIESGEYELEKTAFIESKKYIEKIFSSEVEIKEGHKEALPGRPKINIIWK